MKIRIVSMVALFLLTATQSLWAQSTQKREVSAFTEISLRNTANVHLKQGDKQLVEVKGDATTLEKLITEVNNRTLIIRYPVDRLFNKWTAGSVDIYITLPQIDALTVSGSGSIFSAGNIESRILNLTLSGSGEIKLGGIMADKVSLTLSGSGNVQLTGQQNVPEFKAVVSGSGNVKAIDLPVSQVDVKIAGSGNVWVHAIDRLKAVVVGSGDVIYRGNPSVETSIAGSGNVKEEK